MTSTRRSYRLSPEGLASLRASAMQNKPWEKSTWPRTRQGKARSSQNALKHGLRRAEAIADRREVSEMLHLLRRSLPPLGRMVPGTEDLWRARTILILSR